MGRILHCSRWIMSMSFCWIMVQMSNSSFNALVDSGFLDLLGFKPGLQSHVHTYIQYREQYRTFYRIHLTFAWKRPCLGSNTDITQILYTGSIHIAQYLCSICPRPKAAGDLHATTLDHPPTSGVARTSSCVGPGHCDLRELWLAGSSLACGDDGGWRRPGARLGSPARVERGVLARWGGARSGGCPECWSWNPTSNGLLDPRIPLKSEEDVLQAMQ